MHIDALVLYNEAHEPRVLEFMPGKLNIVTGDSRTGKSSLIGILRFCLGVDSPHAPFGEIRQSVRWYGLLAHVGESHFFIGRPAPAADATTSAAMLIVGLTSIPNFEELVSNTTGDAVRQYLASLTGIKENLHIPSATQSRRALSAGFVHSLYYCFQGQGEIANPEILFHRQNREWQPQAIRDTLPYFLGAQSEGELRKRQELLQLRRDLRILERKLQSAIAEREIGLDRTASLLSEAREVGLYDSIVELEDYEQARELLTSLVRVTSPLVPNEIGGEFERLNTERRELIGDLRALSEQIRILDDYASVGSGLAG